MNKADGSIETALSLLSKCLTALYGLADGGQHEESDLELAVMRLRKIIEAVAPPDRQALYVKALDDALTPTPENRELEAELSTVLPGPFISSRAKRVAHVAEGLRDDLTLGRLRPIRASTTDSAKRSALIPWPIVRGILLESSSYKIPEIIDRTGLAVDWELTDNDNYSNKTRIAAYRRRIDAAYQTLKTEDDRLRVAYIVAKELSNRGSAQELSGALRQIGWDLRDHELVPSGEAIRELFFPDCSQHDAYVSIRAILSRATKQIEIVDPYIDQSILTVLSTFIKSGMSVRILTSKLPADFTLEAGKWLIQYAGVHLEVRTTKTFHDRFIVLDSDGCWHVGCSLKDAGNKAFMISELEDENNRTALLAQVATSWNGATVVMVGKGP